MHSNLSLYGTCDLKCLCLCVYTLIQLMDVIVLNLTKQLYYICTFLFSAKVEIGTNSYDANLFKRKISNVPH